MKHLITFLLSLCSIMAVAQTVTTPPSGSKPYGTPVAAPSGEVLVGRNGSYTYITRKAYTDSLTALGYTKLQVDALLAGYVPITRTINGKALSANVTLTAGDVGAIPTSEKGAANGVATLDINQKVPMSQIPDALVGSVNYQGNYNASTNTPALPASPTSATKGHYYVVSTAGTQFGLDFVAGDWIISNGSQWQKVDNNNSVTSVNGKVGAVSLTAADVGAVAPGDDVSDLNNDAGYITEADILVTSVNGQTGDVSLAANDIGLGNVDNTSDMNKPVSTAQQAALDGKEDLTNKVTSLSSPNNTNYPTTEAVQNAIDAIEPPEVTGENGIQVINDVVSPIFGSSANTVAQGNDSRINNGQTAYGWGDYRQWGLANTGRTPIQMGALSNDMNGIPRSVSGFIYGSNSAANAPSNNHPLGIHIGYNDNVSAQLVIDRSGDTYARGSANGGVWNSWLKFWHSGNFSPSDYIPMSQKGAANGVAELDGSGKVPFSQLPTTNPYKGTWNASTNTPTISDGTGTTGDYYRVSVAGTQNLGSGSITFSAGDDVIYNGSIWQRVPSGISATNLALGTRTSTTVPITNSNGTGVTLPAATTTLAGLLSASDKTKLNSAITDYTETDPTVPSHVKSISTGDISNWNTSFSWGDPIRFGVGSMNYNQGWGYNSLDELDSGDEWPTSFIGTNVSFPDGSPPGFSYPFGMHINVSSTIRGDLIISHSSNRMAFRSDGRSFSEVWHSDNFDPSAYTIPWERVISKPSTYAPSAHTHSASDIVSGTISLARIPTGTTGSTVAMGNDTRIVNAMQSQVNTWINDTQGSPRLYFGSTGASGDNNFVLRLSRSGKFSFRNGNDEEVASIDNGGSATFSQPVTVANATTNGHAVNLGQLTWDNLTVPNGSISNSKLASQAAYTLKGRMGGDGAPQNITMTNLKDMLGLQYFSNTITTPLNLAVGNSVTQNYGVSGLDGNEVVMVSPSGTLNWVNGLTIQARATLNNVSVTVINSTSSNLGAQREIEFNVLIFDPDGIF